MYNRLWLEMARDQRERDSFYDELHPTIPALEAEKARFGGIKARPNGFRLVTPDVDEPQPVIRQRP